MKLIIVMKLIINHTYLISNNIKLKLKIKILFHFIQNGQNMDLILTNYKIIICKHYLI